MTKTSVILLVDNVFHGPLGGAVFMGKSETGQKITAVMNYNWRCQIPCIGEVWKINGERNPPESKYPNSIRVKKAIPVLPPEGNLTHRFLLSNPNFRRFGFGDAKLSRLEKELSSIGISLHQALNEKRYDLLSNTLTSIITQKLISGWFLMKNDLEVYEFLDLYGFELNLAGEIQQILKTNTGSRLRDNPYRLISCVPEKSRLWKQTDIAASLLGIGKDDPRRLGAAIEQVLYHRLDEGHTLTPMNFLKGAVLRLLGSKNEKLFEKAVKSAAALKSVIKCNGGFQAVGPALMETIVEKRLSQLATLNLNASKANSSSFENVCLDRTISEINIEFSKQGFNGFNSSQLQAIKTVCTSALSCVTGGFCTGKTTLLWAVHRIFEKTGETIYQLALEKSSTMCLEKATGRRAYTIYEIIESVQKCSGKNSSARSIVINEGALIVLDEANMIDLPVLCSLLRVLPEKIRLCFVGDPNRLPPIGFGVIFQKLIDVCGVQTIVLDTIVGHKNVTEISRVSDEVRNGHVPKRISFTDKSAAVCFVGCHETEIIKTLFDVSANLNHDCQILTTRQRQGVDCARKVNRFCQRRLVDFLDDKKHFSRGRLFVGDRVVVTNNNNDPGLFKGAIGQITSISITGLPVFRFCDNNYEFADEKISKLGIELAYAITVHNAQCSKFKRIVLPVIKPHGLDRSLIYTALTLAIEQVVFVGSWKVFRAAIMAESKIMATEVGFNLSEAMEV